MANSKVLVLLEITLFVKDSVISSEYDLYFDDSGDFFHSLNKHKSLEILDGGTEYVDYFLVKESIYAVNFISEINNNYHIKSDSYSIVDMLKEEISDYNSSNIRNLFKDIQPLFYSEKKDSVIPKHIEKFGYEKRRFITIFDEYSYWDSYAGDGDYGLNYLQIVDIKNIYEELSKPLVDDNYYYNFFNEKIPIK